MADKRCFDTLLCFVLLLNTCSLKTFGEAENQTNEGKKSEEVVTSKEAVEREGKKSENGISQSHDKKTADEVEQEGDGKTNEGMKVSENVKQPEESKKVEEGKKSEEGKEAEEKKSEEEEKKSEEEEKKSEEEEKKNEEEEKKSEEEEKKAEEPGMELKILNDNDFEHLTQASTGATTGDWLVLFTKKDKCEKCMEVEKEMKILYERIKHKLNVAKVEKGSPSKLTFKRFNIEDLPIIFLFHHGKKFSFEGNKTVEALINFVEGGYQLMPWGTVRDPYTKFEFFLDEALEELQHMLRYKKNVCLIIFLAGFIAGISLTSICGSIIFHLLENFKDDDEEDVREALEKHSERTKNKTE